MLGFLVLLALLASIYLSLSPRQQSSVIRFAIPTGLIVFAFVLCMALGLLIGSLAQSKTASAILSQYLNMPLSKLVSAQIDATDNALAGFSWAFLLILTMTIDLVIFVINVATSFKMPFVTFMFGVWVFFALFVLDKIARPLNEQAARERELDPTGEAGHVQTLDDIFRLHDQGIAARQAEEARVAAFHAAQAAKEAPSKPETLPPLQPGQARIVMDDAAQQFAKRR